MADQKSSCWRRRAKHEASGVGLLVRVAALACVVAGASGVAAQPPAVDPREREEVRQLHDRATKLYGEGKYDEALPPAERALAIMTKTLGPDHPGLLSALNNLASIYQAKGDYPKAEPLYLRAVAVSEKAFGPEHVDLARSLNNLAALYEDRGDYAKAEPLYLRALKVYEKALGTEHTEFAVALNNLAALYYAKDNYALAETFYLWALEILEKALGPDHRDVANALNNLAALYDTTGDQESAEALYLRSLAATEKALGPDHPDVGTLLNNLAALYDAKGDRDSAEPLYLRALAITEKALGPNHPDVAASLGNLATMYEAKGDYARAVETSARGQEIWERNFALVLSTGSERQKLAYLNTHTVETYSTVSLHALSAPADPRALRLALTTVLRRKGRALDAMSDQLASLRRRLDARDRELLDRLAAAQSGLSGLALGGAGGAPTEEHRAAVSRLEAEVERLQDAASRRSAEFRAVTRPVTVEQVRSSIPAGAALVEFFSYRPVDAKAKTQAVQLLAARYVAYVLRADGDPLWVDLGEAKKVDAEVARLLAALKNPAVKNHAEAARALDESVMRPVRALLGGARHVFVSPDGLLNLVPFAALVDEEGKYLVESYSLTYLTSGRDLLRLQVGAESRQPPLVLADPSFGDAGGRGASASGGGAVEKGGIEKGSRSGDMARTKFLPLPGTSEEARALAPMLAGARVLMRAQATELALKQSSSPRVLHVATHGFFLPDVPAEELTTGKPPAGGATAEKSSARIENPMLRSGLALEGANLRRGAGGEDGILTALEASGLDLWGTKLVALSACETGVGEVKNGDGVYGLRRALVLAGSESQVMSLWKVSDEATRDLMVEYYRRLQRGEGRTEALRQVQLGALKGGARKGTGAQRGLAGQVGPTAADRSHPYYWAAFIQSGDWRPMTTK